MSKFALNDDALDQVVGGMLRFNYRTQVMTYTNTDGEVVGTYTINNFDAAWELSNIRHAQNIPEDSIVAELCSKGYIG